MGTFETTVSLTALKTSKPRPSLRIARSTIWPRSRASMQHQALRTRIPGFSRKVGNRVHVVAVLDEVGHRVAARLAGAAG